MRPFNSQGNNDQKMRDTQIISYKKNRFDVRRCLLGESCKYNIKGKCIYRHPRKYTITCFYGAKCYYRYKATQFRARCEYNHLEKKLQETEAENAETKQAVPVEEIKCQFDDENCQLNMEGSCRAEHKNKSTIDCFNGPKCRYRSTYCKYKHTGFNKVKFTRDGYDNAPILYGTVVHYNDSLGRGVIEYENKNNDVEEVKFVRQCIVNKRNPTVWIGEMVSFIIISSEDEYMAVGISSCKVQNMFLNFGNIMDMRDGHGFIKVDRETTLKYYWDTHLDFMFTNVKRGKAFIQFYSNRYSNVLLSQRIIRKILRYIEWKKIYVSQFIFDNTFFHFGEMKNALDINGETPILTADVTRNLINFPVVYQFDDCYKMAKSIKLNYNWQEPNQYDINVLAKYFVFC